MLDEDRKKELTQYILEIELQNNTALNPIHSAVFQSERQNNGECLKDEICIGELCFNQNNRMVKVRGKEINLTAKEFDILALLIMNPKRVFTYDMIMEIIWNENCDIYARRTIINHVSNLRKKLKVSLDIPNYIKNIHCIGYKFNE
ncbi:MAG: winged helix-turn-helix domain-containing protein [Lachnospiraceae bacterium]|nr:winged helix-turn-helix domain-containing protein [Lachnospiraceae bacterium]